MTPRPPGAAAGPAASRESGRTATALPRPVPSFPVPAMTVDRPRLPSRRDLFAALAGFACLEAGGPDAEADDRAPTVDLPKPGERDLCPVCGMFVAKYPLWVATLKWKDGALAHFDGAKDLFKYLGDLPRWAPGRARAP